MTIRSIAKLVLIVCLCTLTACATTGPPPVGTSSWHDQRLMEIEQSYQLGNISEAEDLQLKNEADQIRGEYRGAQIQSRRPSLVIGGSFGHFHHRHRRHR